MSKRKTFLSIAAAFILFFIVSYIGAEFAGNTLCDCFATRYGKWVAYILGFVFFGIFSFIEYKLSNRETAEAWYDYLLWLVLGVVFYAIIFLEIIYNGNKFGIGGPYGPSNF